MDLVYIFSSFVSAIGFDVFFFLLLAYFVLMLVPYARKPLPLAFLLIVFAAIFLGKMGIGDIFSMFTFEITILYLFVALFFDKVGNKMDYYLLGLALVAFVWVI